ncbi:MAG: potassium transporter Kup [Desulfatiglandaceae bacterium]|jgi:KUP system potassium uptake protein
MHYSNDSDQAEREDRRAPNARLLKLALTALGIVYGDIGTSPIYAVRACFREGGGLSVTTDNVLGILSLVFWSLVLVISLKYLTFVMRADNRGEGGILALGTLATGTKGKSHSTTLLLGMLGLFGAALLYGDGMITPAISVLSAIEGLTVATNFFEPYVIPISLVILTSLFLFQRRGTAGIGAIFGPVMILWFIVMALLGIRSILHEPQILAAVDPGYAFEVFSRNGWRAFTVLGTVFLVVTGGEALYADMGHFGRRPILLGWFSFVCPALLLNYFGQGALLLRDPQAVNNLFYRLAPGWALYPLVVLSAAATVIASQAVISGAFSLTRQAVQLGYCPRLAILHTSSEQVGQVYVPSVNWTIFAGTICLVLGFRHSNNLAAAYGVAVSATMVITTALIFFVARHRWHWSLPKAFCISAGFLLIDLGFFSSNVTKIPSGGWVPLLIASLVFSLMTTWKMGRKQLKKNLDARVLHINDFLHNVRDKEPVRVPGVAVFLGGNPSGTPGALINNFEHNKILHEKVILLHVATQEIPYVRVNERAAVEPLGDGFYRVTLHYGFIQSPNIPIALARLDLEGEKIRTDETTYFLGRERLLITKDPGMSSWRKKLFAFLSTNAGDATTFFRIPSERVVELGVQVEF